MADTVDLRVEDSLGIVTIDRPDSKNAINEDVWQELDEIAETVASREDVSAMVTRGAEGTFSTGADVNQFEDPDRRPTTEKLGYPFRVQETIETLPLPTVAAIDGYALGGGLELAACHDFRIATDDAQLGFPEIGIGIFPGAGGTQRVPRLIGVPKTKELVFSGRMISGTEAEDIGLVDETVSSGDLLESAEAFVEPFLDKPPAALAASKMAINEVWKGSELREGLLYETVASNMVFETNDREEGIDASQSDREPEWEGW